MFSNSVDLIGANPTYCKRAGSSLPKSRSVLALAINSVMNGMIATEPLLNHKFHDFKSGILTSGL